MSHRHTHVTSFLYDEPDRIAAFVEAARTLPGGFFQHVVPIVRPGDDRPRAMMLFSNDMAGFEDEQGMPEVAEALSGILEHDIEIVSAWEGGDHARGMFRSTPRERVWLVPGRESRAGSVIAGEVVHRELEG